LKYFTAKPIFDTNYNHHFFLFLDDTFAASDRELFIRQVFTEKITLGWGNTQDEKTDEIHTVLVRVYDDSGLAKMLTIKFGEDFAVDGLKPSTQYKLTGIKLFS